MVFQNMSNHPFNNRYQRNPNAILDNKIIHFLNRVPILLLLLSSLKHLDVVKEVSQRKEVSEGKMK